MAKRAALASVCPTKHQMGDRVDNVLEDRISGLPDEILISIISRLMTKEAGRSSVLSKRWRYIWTSTTSLNFDASQTLDEVQLGSKLIKLERSVYRTWVNQVLKLHKGPTIDEFRVRFDLDKSCSYDIDNWVKFAMGKKVQRLELNLSDYLGAAQNQRYSFPDQWEGLINQLHQQPVGFSSCKSLTSLQLTYVNIPGEVLQYFLSNCPFLEHLSVDGSDSIVNLKVAGPSLNLKCLEICYCFGMKSIDISAPNLLVFKYFGPKIRIPFNNFPKLVEMSLGGACCEYLTNNFLEYSRHLSQLEKLTLDMDKIKKSMESVKLPVFTSLKQLELIVSPGASESLLGFISLIKASPFLHKFALQLLWAERHVKRKQRKAAACPHHYLKVVELVGFLGNAIDVELAVYLMESAVMLEKIIFDPRKPLLAGTPWEFEDTEEKRAARKCAEQLGAELPPGAALVIL